MSNTDLVIELLEKISPESYCDDCLSLELGITPRQQVNQICRNLEIKKKILRQDGKCFSCKKHKKVNALILFNRIDESTSHSISEYLAEPFVSEKRQSDTSFKYLEKNIGDYGKLKISSEVEHGYKLQVMRREIVQICQKIWSKSKKDPFPRSVSSSINELKSEECIPDHQANMMLTICGMRNCFEYGGLEFGKREKAISENAWDIIQEWWIKTKNQYST